MEIVEIKSKDFRAIIAMELNKNINDVIYKEELGQIKDITLNKYKLSSEKTDINLEEISVLDDLEHLLIANFEIDDNAINIIQSMKKLKTLQFSKCIFSTASLMDNSLEYLIIDNCKNFDEATLAEAKIVRIVGNEDLDLKKIMKYENVNKLYLQNCKIRNFEFILKFENLKYLNLDGSKIDNPSILEYIKPKIDIVYRKKYYILEGN